MKYIKQYEENTEPQIGDYAIVKDSVIGITAPFLRQSVNVESFAHFLSENIGKIVADNHSYKYPFLIQFENIPDNLKDEFNMHNNDMRDMREFNRNEMIAFSPNKEDLEHIISANKYNL